MLFNSLSFLVFLPITFMIYWFGLGKSIKGQNFFILLASYLFYGWWDWRFLSLIFFSTAIDYLVGIKIAGAAEKKIAKRWLGVSLITNLGLLGIFKYYDFFVDSFGQLLTSLGLEAHPATLNIILPVGISFYTFQTLSYSIDIYRGQLKPTGDFLAFAAFVSFFPQLVAGPIERAGKLLPQFFQARQFDFSKGRDGLRQILWGMFKKVVIADSCAPFVNEIFGAHASFSWPVLILGAVLFAFQIYGDFSGYSDIAIGTARLFGFDLMRNFAYPYFSRDVAEFWRRWHISLSTWFRDYVYIPLGGSQGNLNSNIRNVVLVFSISGLWHGANWTFLFWGAFNGLLFLPLLVLGQNRKNLDFAPSLNAGDLLKILLTFTWITLGWIFFRAANISEAFGYIFEIVSFQAGQASFLIEGRLPEITVLSILIGLMLLTEWVQRFEQHGLSNLGFGTFWRWSSYLALTFLILYHFQPRQDFIYFQF